MRVGYFADIFHEESVAIASVTEFRFKIKHCKVYLLENTQSDSHIGLYMSSNRGAKLDITEDGTVTTINAESDFNLPR